MDFKIYVQNAIASYVSKESKGTLFIKHYNTLEITKNDIIAQVSVGDNVVFLYHEYVMHEMHDPYDPFLTWIRYFYNTFYKSEMSVEDFLKKCGVYSLHIEPLAGLIRNDTCTRSEDLLYFEVYTEKKIMLQNILKIIECVSKEHSLLLIISKLHLAPYSTISLLKSIVDKVLNLHMVLVFNDEFVITGYKKNVWNGLLQSAADRNLQLEWGSLDSERTIDVQDEFWFDKKFMDEYLHKLRNMYYTFTLEDANYYINNIMNRIDEKTIRLGKRDLISFLMISALINMNLDQADMALVMCDKLTDLHCDTDEDIQLRYDYYYTYARARMYANQTEPVKDCCDKCMEIARKMGNGYLEFRAEILKYVMLSTMGHDLFEYEFNFLCNDEIVEKAKKYGFWNFLSYIYVFGFDNDPQSLHDIALGEKEPHYFNLAIEIGRRLGNEFFLLNAYMKNIILYSEVGYHKYVREMYKQRLKVLGRPQPVSEAHMLAGLGYNAVILEDYEKAHSYLCKSVTNLAGIEQSGDVQPMDIMNSLYNLALIHFVAENYRGTADNVELILKILKEINYNSIRACSNTRLFSFIAISCYYLNDYYNCYFYLSKIEVIVEHMIMFLQEQNDGNWDEDIALYHLVKGIMYSYENKLGLSLSEFTKLKEGMNKIYGSLFFIMPVYSVELSSLYIKQGKLKEADEAIDEGIRFCEKENLNRKKDRLLYFKEHRTRMTQPLMQMEDHIPIDTIMQVAKRVGNQLKLAKREKDIQFLTVLQESINRENMTVDDLFMNTSAVVKNSYNIDEIIILRRRKGKRILMVENEKHKLTDEAFDSIFDFFLIYKQAFLSNRSDKNFTQFLPIINYFSDIPIMTIIGIPIMEEIGTETVLLGYVKVKRRSVNSHVLLNNDDLMILKFAFSQFCEMMRRIDSRQTIERMNRKLEQSAVTDHLTGITNRTGFSKQTEILCSQSTDSTNVLLYLDLDNFKYYNDTFGHEVGDLVLVTFAEIFKRMTVGKGLAVRYGGDEFIILLYDQTEKDGVRFAEQLYDEIKDGFVERIKEKLNMEITIPDNRKISCSIGIASFKGGSKEEMEVALNRADQMLYHVKRHGKSHYKLYEGE